MEERFDVAVALFLFKRRKAVEIVKRISSVKPRRLYLIADGARDREEEGTVQQCRQLVEQAIDWKCEVIKNYAPKNRGVYANIGLGARWVLEREKYAIFLEDDNLPETTFFRFCREMLLRYENDTRILWICGTNYLGRYEDNSRTSYFFTRHLLPCGWASWADKFLKFYDGELTLCENPFLQKRVAREYWNQSLYHQYRNAWMAEYYRICNGEKPRSWDYQMDWSLKVNGLYGISPAVNQIRNIGVDMDSIHGGNSWNNEMTRRFCGMESYPLEFPLKHPSTVLLSEQYEAQIAQLLLYPLNIRIRSVIARAIKRLLKIDESQSLKSYLKASLPFISK